MKTRMAADRRRGDHDGSARVDRGTSAHQRFQGSQVYFTLTNNNRRGTSPPSVNSRRLTTAGRARPPVDASRPARTTSTATSCAGAKPAKSERHYVLVGTVRAGWRHADRQGPQADQRLQGQHRRRAGRQRGFGAPDGLSFDSFGRLWVQTDQAGNGSGDLVNIGSNCMACADPNTGATRRFLTPRRTCEVTGVTMTPDGRTMFVGYPAPGRRRHWPRIRRSSRTGRRLNLLSSPTASRVAARTPPVHR